MSAFDNNWETLGYHRGEIKFYTIDTSLFGGWRHAFPTDCVTALDACGWANPLPCPNKSVSVQWILRKYTAGRGGASVTQLGPIDGAASAKSSGCIEHSVHWPQVGGKHMPMSQKASEYVVGALKGSGSTFFTSGSTIIIYSTWQPCLSCCNSLFSLARDHNLDINLIVRFSRIYDIDVAGALADATILIPKKDTILSVDKPSPSDRSIFVFHDGVNELKNLVRVGFEGEMKPVDLKNDLSTTPHTNGAAATTDHPGGQPCNGLRVKDVYSAWGEHEPKGVCATCDRSVPIYGAGSGLPWNTGDASKICSGYNAQQNYNSRRL